MSMYYSRYICHKLVFFARGTMRINSSPNNFIQGQYLIILCFQEYSVFFQHFKLLRILRFIGCIAPMCQKSASGRGPASLEKNEKKKHNFNSVVIQYLNMRFCTRVTLVVLMS
jgi:hypothetical protein